MRAGLQPQPASARMHALGGVSRKHELTIDKYDDLVVSTGINLHFLTRGKEPEATPAHAEDVPPQLGPLLQEAQTDVWGDVPGQPLALKIKFGIDRANQTRRGDNPSVQSDRQCGQHHGGDHVNENRTRPTGSHRKGVVR